VPSAARRRIAPRQPFRDTLRQMRASHLGRQRRPLRTNTAALERPPGPLARRLVRKKAVVSSKPGWYSSANVAAAFRASFSTPASRRTGSRRRRGSSAGRPGGNG
jgi:hypothetical protein